MTRTLLFAIALLLLAGCSSPEEPATGEPRQATRRSAASCDVAEASRSYQPYVGELVHARFAWNDMPSNAADLEVPLGVLEVLDDGVAVHVPEIPLRHHYLVLWQQSGHLRIEGERLVLDPCSAERVSES